MDLLFHFFTHSLVDSCVCPDQGSNQQPATLACRDDTLSQLSHPAGPSPFAFFCLHFSFLSLTSFLSLSPSLPLSPQQLLPNRLLMMIQ